MNKKITGIYFNVLMNMVIISILEKSKIEKIHLESLKEKLLKLAVKDLPIFKNKIKYKEFSYSDLEEYFEDMDSNLNEEEKLIERNTFLIVENTFFFIGLSVTLTKMIEDLKKHKVNKDTYKSSKIETAIVGVMLKELNDLFENRIDVPSCTFSINEAVKVLTEPMELIINQKGKKEDEY